ncbi:hypothetical protein Scep_001190 [Stephania cephalantha]|uniref:Uncharacterized protein n=1 Tax=Stephania cephalantha TaxID=152367 RepID=A0AAP0Q4T9_9MAGN
MKKEEKQRKFHQTLLNILYPSSPSSLSPSPVTNSTLPILSSLTTDNPNPRPIEFSVALKEDKEEEEEEEQHDDIASSDLNLNPDDGNSPSDASGFESGKLTRAQRKRLRRKKLKQEANSGRRKLIGPLLPPSANDCDNNKVVGEDEQSSVLDHGIGEPGGGLRDCISQNKVRRRRVAKRMERGASSVDAGTQVDGPPSNAAQLIDLGLMGIVSISLSASCNLSDQSFRLECQRVDPFTGPVKETYDKLRDSTRLVYLVSALSNSRYDSDL